MKKTLIAAAVTLVLLLAGGGIWAAFNMIEPEAPAPAESDSQQQGGLLGPSGNGDRQPAVNNTPLTHADIFDQIGKAKQINEDTVGWLKIPGTDIDNSVLQSYDNDYYLRRTEKGEYDIFGCYFADYECNIGSRDVLSPNTIIYGHSDLRDNPDGQRFSQLFHFTDETFARNTPYIYFSSDKEYLVWQVFSVFYTDTGMDYISVKITPEKLASIIAEGREKSLYDYEVTVDETDKILCLSTCSAKYGGRPDERFVVMAKLLPADAELAGTAALAVNPDPMQPAFSN